jgi:autotransporter-associated beta strand protein
MLKPNLFFLAAGILPAAAIPAFPGAEGYGANAIGGRGGDVYHVTNLNASGAGSFAEGIGTVPAAGRTIVFDVSGYIRLPSGSNGTRLTSSKVTIAGQTAPGDGIGFYNNFFRISGDDIIVRHVRFRHGYYGSGGDCVDLDSGCLNAILDHVSMQFSTDENMSSFGSPPENLTLQYSLNAWGLESHSCGGLWDQNHATSHHNLWAHNHTRNPKARPGGLLEWVNNVTYDWDIGFIMGDSQSNQDWKSNVINNYFIGPPGNTHSKALVKGTVGDNGKPNFTVHLNGNLSDTDGDGLLNGTDKGYGIVEGTSYAPGTGGLTPGAAGYYQSSNAITGSTVGVTTDAPLLAYKKIVSNAGALRLDASHAGTIRDEVDTILMGKLTTQTHFHVSRESDTGASNSGFGVLNSTLAPVDTDRDGMPDYYESALAWNPATQDHNTALASSGGVITGTTFFPTGTAAGYTRLEEYLHFLAIPHGTVPRNIVDTPSSIQIDLRRYTSGFALSPSFTVAAISNGNVTQYLADGVTPSATGPVVRFTPTLNFTGRARFDFTVTDAAGSAWTQTMALLVSQSGLPRDLLWKGSGNTWDTTTATNWLRPAGGATVTYSDGDRVVFDQSGIAQPNVTVTGTLVPATVEVNATGNYTLGTGGTGSLNSAGTLTKRGTGTLTLAHAETYAGGTSLEAGTLAIANPGSLAGGAIAMLDGTALTNAYPTGTSASLPAGINVPADSTATINTGNRISYSGPMTGAGIVNFNVETTVSRVDLKGATAAFAGNLNFTNGGGVRLFFNGGSFNGFDNASVNLAGSIGFQPQTNSGGNTLNIGALSGTNTAANLGGGSAGTVAYAIGAKGTDTTFAGTITGNASLTKTGAGTLTLGGVNTYTGATAVNQGALLIDGSFGTTATTVASGALLGGDGTLGGSLTASAGAILSPGTIPFTGAAFTANGGLALNGNTLYYDMTSNAGGANDKIVMGGGNLAFSGTQYFQFYLIDGTLNAGTYDLITGAATTSGTPTFTHNLPASSRQTFAIAMFGTTVRLTVTGNPATITWTGATSANWDTTTANNWTGAVPNTFSSNDAVVFDDTSTVNNVNIGAAVAPRSTTFNNATRAYTLGGTAGITSGALVKNGAAALTLTGTNSPWNTTINAGATITFANDTANIGGLGTGPITFNGGTLSMYNNQSGFSSSTMNLIVPAGQTGTLNADSRHDIYGTLTGSGTLNFRAPWIRTNLFCDWSDFTGTLNITTDADGGELRMSSNYYFPGFPLATVNLADRVWAYYTGILSEGEGTIIEIGELSGGSLSGLRGGATGGRNFTYRIGAKTPAANEVVFAGTIQEQNADTTTSIVKTGAGSWKLSGAGSWNGGTSVEQGTLAISGNVSSTAAVGVASGAALSLSNGSVVTDSVTIASGASLTGYGAISADLVCNGTFTARGFSTGTPGTLSVTDGAFFDGSSLMKMRGGVSSDLIAVSGDLNLAGTVQVALAPGTGFGRYPLFTYGGALSGSALLTGIPAGTTAHLSTSTAGQVALVIDDGDEDGLPDSWEQANFGGLTETAAGDKDGDGTSNLAEYRLGLNPSSAASAFKSTVSATGRTITWPSANGIVFTVKRNLTLEGEWQTLGTVTGGASSTASFTDTAAFDKAFYKIEFTP